MGMAGSDITPFEVSASFQDRACAERFPPVLSIQQFADLMSVSTLTVNTWILQGFLRSAVNHVGESVFLWRDRAVAQMFHTRPSGSPSLVRFHPRRINEKVVLFQRGKKGTYYAELSDARRRVSLRTSNGNEATRRAMLLLKRGSFLLAAPAPTTVENAVKEFLEAKKVEKRAPKTLEKYRNQLRCFVLFGNRNGCATLAQVTARSFDAYRIEQSKVVSTKSLYSDSVTIKSLIRWCVTRDYLSKNPLSLIKLTKPRPRVTYTPTMDEVAAILRKCQGRDRAIFSMLAMTGLRACEMRMLRPGDVRIDEGWLHVVCRDEWRTKTGDSRKVPLHSTLLAQLKTEAEHRDTGRPYFFTVPPGLHVRSNQPIYLRALTINFQSIAKSIGIPIGRQNEGIVLHSLRHFFETECVNAGVPQMVIDGWMGHSDGKQCRGFTTRTGIKSLKHLSRRSLSSN